MNGRAGVLLATMAVALIAAVSMATHGGPARANGVPQLVKLTYIDGVSNFGPVEGEGVLEFSFAEAYARVDVKNLPAPEGFVYEGWLTGGEGAPFRVGDIPVDGSGIGALETRLNGLDRYDYDVFIVAARAAGRGASTEMPQQRSIAGRFTVIQDGPDGANNGDTEQPALLPETGEREAGGVSTVARTLIALGAMGVVAGCIFTARRTFGRRAGR